jgi:hypothetical protein
VSLQCQYQLIATPLFLSMFPLEMASWVAFRSDKLCNLKYGHQVMEDHLPSPWILTVANPDNDNV